MQYPVPCDDHEQLPLMPPSKRQPWLLLTAGVVNIGLWAVIAGLILIVFHLF